MAKRVDPLQHFCSPETKTEATPSSEKLAVQVWPKCKCSLCLVAYTNIVGLPMACSMRLVVSTAYHQVWTDSTKQLICFTRRDNPENGPSFGADSLVIPLGKEQPKVARSKLGSYYERFADGTNSLFGRGKNQVLLKDLKVYHGVYAEGEFIPFTDGKFVCCVIYRAPTTRRQSHVRFVVLLSS